jgi:hypothetical protein
LDLRSSLSIQPFEGSRFVRGGRYGISIDFGLEVVEKQSVCGTIFESEFIALTKKLKLTIALIVTRDRAFCKTPKSRISDAASFGHAITSAAKRLRSNALVLTDRGNFWVVGSTEVIAKPSFLDCGYPQPGSSRDLETGL